MSSSRARLPDFSSDITPAGRLVEAGLKGVLGYQLAQAGVTTERIYAAAVGNETGLHRLEYTVLMLVHENPGCTATSLAKALNVSAPNMALWLERVSVKGFLSRATSQVDRRASHLHLTAEGEQAVTSATDAIVAAEQAGIAALTPGERALLLELLHKVAASRPAGR